LQLLGRFGDDRNWFYTARERERRARHVDRIKTDENWRALIGISRRSALEAIELHEAIVVGAGPAGLAASRELTRAEIRHVVLERGDTIGHTWVHLYDGLVLHTGKHLSALPGMRFPSSTPLFPTRAHFVDYLRRYTERFDVRVQTNADVQSIAKEGNTWSVECAGGARSCALKQVVVATGSFQTRTFGDPEPGALQRTCASQRHYRRPGPSRISGCWSSAQGIRPEKSRRSSPAPVRR
jgi:glycine/D-amino acid oxidase-like deaminating enzyme